MLYRRATLHDVRALAELNGQLIRDQGSRNRMTLDELIARMSGWIGEGGEYEATLFYVDDGDAALPLPSGYALFRREDACIYLRQFFVGAAHRRRGIGREVIAWLRSNVWTDAPRITVECLVGNPAGLAFWRAMGFVDYSVTMELARDTFIPHTLHA